MAHGNRYDSSFPVALSYNLLHIITKIPMRKLYRYFKNLFSRAEPKDDKSVDAHEDGIRGNFTFWPGTEPAADSQSGSFQAK